MKARLVVIGNGMVGMRAVEELLLRAPRHYDITVFGAEPNVNYNRIMLSPLLAGEKPLRTSSSTAVAGTLKTISPCIWAPLLPRSTGRTTK